MSDLNIVCVGLKRETGRWPHNWSEVEYLLTPCGWTHEEVARMTFRELDDGRLLVEWTFDDDKMGTGVVRLTFATPVARDTP